MADEMRPTRQDCERCLREIPTLYGVAGDPADALERMTPGDAEDYLQLADATAQGLPATDGLCADCRARYGGN